MKRILIFLVLLTGLIGFVAPIHNETGPMLGYSHCLVLPGGVDQAGIDLIAEAPTFINETQVAVPLDVGVEKPSSYFYLSAMQAITEGTLQIHNSSLAGAISLAGNKDPQPILSLQESQGPGISRLDIGENRPRDGERSRHS